MPRGKAGLQEGVRLELVLRVLQELEYSSSTVNGRYGKGFKLPGGDFVKYLEHHF